MVSRLPMSSMARWMARHSSPMSSRFSRRPLIRVMSSSWTTCAPTRSRVWQRPSKRSVQRCAICRPTRPTSIRSRWRSPSSRRHCAKAPRAQSTPSGSSSVSSSKNLRPRNAPTTFSMLVTGDDPHHVGNALEPGKHVFDLLVIDEASQMRPEDALGAMLRCQQAIIVGDPEQLPPTDFFTAADDGNQQQAEDAPEESILELGRRCWHPMRMLEVHYRSRHHSLIAYSNREFYGERLLVY